MSSHSLIRDSTFGQLVRLATGRRVLKYAEEVDSFECPDHYIPGGLATPPAPTESAKEKEEEVAASRSRSRTSSEDLSKNELAQIPTADPEDHVDSHPHLEGIRSSETRSRSMRIIRSQSFDRANSQMTQNALDLAVSTAFAGPQPSRPVIPDKLEDGTVLVDWYTTDDPENPQNWPFSKKLMVTIMIGLYTTAVYMGSSIYAPAELQVMERFGVNVQLASMGLSMYVLAYGLGPMLWSPLSEIPLIGRNPPYILTYAIFVILTVPTALVDNFPGLIVLRFLLGFFGSPCLATGGATLQDMWDITMMPYMMCAWAFCATSGPALGPIISGFSVTAENWRWQAWEMLWLSAPIFLVMFFFLPETNPSTILLQRARRLRQKTGNEKLKSQSEIDQAHMSVTHLILENLYRPMQMMALDPAVGFTALYTALIYGIYYSFFESFPLVYNDMYHFNLGESGLTFLSITVGVVIAIAIYYSYIYWILNPWMRKNGFGAPERRLLPALIATLLCPVGLFIFAWTSNPKIHWIAPTIGIMIFTLGIFIVIQCIFIYLPLTYPQYAASLFAGNDLTRSTLATAAIHFSRPLFGNLGVGRGVSLLGGLTAGCCIGLYALWYFGARLRARSRFSAKY